MARAYSDDLRSTILRAYEREQLGLEALAGQFGVSYGYTKKVRRQQLQTGRMERVPQAPHGPESLAEQLEQSCSCGSAGSHLGSVSQRLGCGVKIIAPRQRARPSTSVAAAASLGASE